MMGGYGGMMQSSKEHLYYTDQKFSSPGFNAGGNTSNPQLSYSSDKFMSLPENRS